LNSSSRNSSVRVSKSKLGEQLESSESDTSINADDNEGEEDENSEIHEADDNEGGEEEISENLQNVD
tara:strand:- start:254 stop:454 length:201 start_codon:yes stop_codon:yes gene_type:complete